MVRKIVTALTGGLLLFTLIRSAAAGDTGNLRFQVIPEASTIVKNGDLLIGLRQTPAPGWHSYWVNPGDVGLATEITWDLPQGVSVGTVDWPTPERLPYSGGMTYGYTGPATLIVRLHNDSGRKSGSSLPITAHIASLVCDQVCQPVDADLHFTLKVSDQAPAGRDPSLVAALKALPTPMAVRSSVDWDKGRVGLELTPLARMDEEQLRSHPREGAYLFVEQGTPIPAQAAQAVAASDHGLRVTTPASATAWPQQSVKAVLAFADGAAFELRLSPGDRVELPPVPHGIDAVGVMLAIGLAFAGGLVLNLMPCVFPILSMKLLALARAGGDRRMAVREATLYGLGCVLSFVGLSLALELCRQLGLSLGWGFQLQSPLVTGALGLLMALVGLNLSGLFEMGGSVQSAANARSWAQHPVLRAFFTGVLAVVVAAPCTAPFMATAMGVALAQGRVASLAIFTALGLGFAAPFVVLTFAIGHLPALARRMPRPGAWMDRIKQTLAIPMYLAALWMGWVFAQQTSRDGLAIYVLAVGLTGVSLCGLKQPPLKAGGIVGGLLLALLAALQQPPAGATPRMAQTDLRRPFSVSTLEELRAQHRPVLVDLTAAWCVTCEVNQRVVLDDALVQTELTDSRTVYLVGDWTRQDAAITAYLAQFGRSGVPLYVYYGPSRQAPTVLPQILTVDAVLKALRGGNIRLGSDGQMMSEGQTGMRRVALPHPSSGHKIRRPS